MKGDGLLNKLAAYRQLAHLSVWCSHHTSEQSRQSTPVATLKKKEKKFKALQQCWSLFRHKKILHTPAGMGIAAL